MGLNLSIPFPNSHCHHFILLYKKKTIDIFEKTSSPILSLVCL